MTGHVIAVVNMKGGVGKSTLVVSLSETLAALDQAPVLVADLDAQATASYCLAGDELLTSLIEDEKTIEVYFEAGLVKGQRKQLDPFICSHVSEVTHLGNNLDVSLLASSYGLRITEREIIYSLTQQGFGLSGVEGQTKKILAEDLERLRTRYRYIIFDCAPGISAFTTAAVALADLVLVPTIPDFLSHSGLMSFTSRIIREQRPSTAKPPLVVITKKKQTNQHEEYVALMQSMAERPGAPFRLAHTIVKEAAAFPNALDMVGEYPTYSTKYPPAISSILGDLASEVKEALR